MSSALAMDIMQSCTKPLIWLLTPDYFTWAQHVNDTLCSVTINAVLANNIDKHAAAHARTNRGLFNKVVVRVVTSDCKLLSGRSYFQRRTYLVADRLADRIITHIYSHRPWSCNAHLRTIPNVMHFTIKTINSNTSPKMQFELHQLALWISYQSCKKVMINVIHQAKTWYRNTVKRLWWKLEICQNTRTVNKGIFIEDFHAGKVNNKVSDMRLT